MAAEKTENALSKRDFSKVILTLQNVLIPPPKLMPTPSLIDGLDSESEMDLRILGCELIQTSGILLKLPQVAMATGQVLFQRFYYSKSFVKHNMEVLAMGCVNLASKIEECPRRIRDVINVFHHVKQMKNGKTFSPLILDQNYVNTKNQVIKAERRVLKELGFCVHVKHPHKIIVMYLQVLECHKNQKLVQCCWNYMNDSLRTNVFVRYHPETIACACIYLASRQLQIPLPVSPPWWACFQVEEDDLKDICLTILRLYATKKPNPEKLEAIVNEAKKVYNEAKIKAKGMSSEVGTPNSESRAATPTKGQSPLTVPNIKKIKSEDEHSNSSHGRDYYNHSSKKKRSHSHSSRSHSRSRSRTPRSRSKSRSYSSRSRSRSFSRSRSRSPLPKHRYFSPSRKYHKEPRMKNGKDKHSRKRRRSPSYPRSRSRSFSRSPERDRNRNRAHKKYYKEKYRSRSRSQERYISKQERFKSRSRSRSKERSRKIKKRNGHSRDRYGRR